MADLEIFSKNVRDLLLDSDKKQREISEMTGINRNTIKNYMRNESYNMSVDSLLRICRAFNTTPDALCGFKEKDTVSLAGLTGEEKKEVREYIAAKNRKLGK